VGGEPIATEQPATEPRWFRWASTLLIITCVGTVAFPLLWLGFLTARNSVAAHWPPGREARIQGWAEQALPPPTSLRLERVRIWPGGDRPYTECLIYHTGADPEVVQETYRRQLRERGWFDPREDGPWVSWNIFAQARDPAADPKGWPSISLFPLPGIPYGAPEAAHASYEIRVCAASWETAHQQVQRLGLIPYPGSVVSPATME
jgi:hypothetical protein